MFIAQDVVNRSLEELGLLNTKNVNIYKTVLKFSKGDINNSERIIAKNNILLFLMESQKISYALNIDVLQNKCKCCEGRGFNVFTFDSILVKCKLEIVQHTNGKVSYYGCNGTGHKITKCLKCNGTGKIGENPCATCFDPKTKQSMGTFIHWKPRNPDCKEDVMCLKCLGSGRIKKLIQRESEIKKVDNCLKCNGSGIDNNIGTPVLSATTAKLLNLLQK